MTEVESPAGRQYTQAEVADLVKNMKDGIQDAQQDFEDYMKKWKCHTCNQMSAVGHEICWFCWDKTRRFWHKKWFWSAIITAGLFCPFNSFAGYKWGIAVQWTTTGFFVGGTMLSPLCEFVAEFLNARRKWK